MSLKFNNVEVTGLYFNGVEQKSLKYNDSGYFGKRYSLTENTSTGVTVTVSRISSPNQRAATGSVTTGQTIYYGDEITISVSAAANYTNPILYVDMGGGFIQRTSPFSFTVTDNVRFYGTAAPLEDWKTVWSGLQIFTSGGSFTVPGLESGGEVQVTADVIFGEWYKYSYDGSTAEKDSFMRGISRGTLPTAIGGITSFAVLMRNGNQIDFTFYQGEEYAKGYSIVEYPIAIRFTEVRRRG